jgi:hypothetical protein
MDARLQAPFALHRAAPWPRPQGNLISVGLQEALDGTIDCIQPFRHDLVRRHRKALRDAQCFKGRCDILDQLGNIIVVPSQRPGSLMV